MGSPLDVVVDQNPPVRSIALLSSRAEQIRHLKFMNTSWTDITTFSDVYSGPLPLLDTLDISTFGFHDAFNQTIFPSHPFFGGAVNLKSFVLDSEETYLNRFVFPNLVTFEVSASPIGGFNVSDFLNFLKASPTLQTVKVKAEMVSELVGNPQEIVVLPDLDTFSLLAIDGVPMYDIATFISCPRARYTSLEYTVEDYATTPHLEMFPSPISWNAIVHQYTKNPAGEAKLEIKHPDHCRETVGSSLTFRSSDSTTLFLCFHTPEPEEHEDVSLEETYYELFSQTYRNLQNHPQLSHIKRLHIRSRIIISESGPTLLLANQVGGLFGSLGPLDQLTLDSLDSHILIPFLDLLGSKFLSQPIVFPPIRELTISHPSMGPIDEAEFADAIVELAKSQYERGIPFEHVTIRTRKLDTTVAERLRQWVGVVDYFEEWQIIGE